MKDIVAESGAIFYSPPNAMDQSVDPLIRPICERINGSGFVWTAESCQGHPDAAEAGTWASNNAPFIRLVTREEDLGRMLSCLCKAFPLVEKSVLESNRRDAPSFQIFEVHGFRVYPSSRPNPGWTETLIYIDAANVYQRNQALQVWAAFAELLQP